MKPRRKPIVSSGVSAKRQIGSVDQSALPIAQALPDALDAREQCLATMGANDLAEQLPQAAESGSCAIGETPIPNVTLSRID